MNILWLLFLLPIAGLGVGIWMVVGVVKAMNRNDNRPTHAS